MKELIKHLRKELKDNEQSHLPLYERLKLYALINDPTIINKIFFECSKKVFFLWEKQYPSPSPISEILEKGYLFLFRGKGIKEDFEYLADKYRNYADDDSTEAGTAGLATIYTAYSIGSDASLVNKKNYQGQDDNEFDQDEWLPDYLGSLAYSQGNPFIGEGSKSKRKEFWKWFLDLVETLLAHPYVPVVDLFITQPDTDDNVEFQRDQSHETSIIEELKTEIMDTVVDDIEEDGYTEWDKCHIHAENCQMGDTYNVEIEVNGKIIPYDGYNMSVPDYFHKMKILMYEQVPEEGAWCFCDLSFTPFENEPIEISFFYDKKELFEKSDITPDFIKVEFNEYPRKKDFTPEWMQKIIGKNAKYIK